MRTPLSASPYARLAAMALLAFVAMYFLLFAMVDRYDNVMLNVNQAYLAGLMAAPVVLLELVLMNTLYRRLALNAAVAGLCLIVGGFCLYGIREQARVDEEQLLKSMIPRHASAVLMCREAKLYSREAKDLCRQIVAGQQREIEQMKAILGKS